MKDVIIIGAGLSGLTAANYLQQKELSFLILEAEGQVGGRIKTSTKDGFLLDHGFQVFAKAYPEAKALLDYEKLDLHAFLPGAFLLQGNGKIDRIGDPTRDWSSLLPTFFAKAGSLNSKLNILKLKQHLSKKSIEDIFSNKESTYLQALEEYGFDQQLIKHFFKPFFSGIFLEKGSLSSRYMFDFVFKMFAEDDVVVPAQGMQAIPNQLAANLPKDSILLNKSAVDIDGGKVTTADGQIYEGRCILLATEAIGLAATYIPVKQQEFVSTTQLYFSSVRAPLNKPIIALNTQPNQLVNNFTVISQVAPSYAPAGKQLLSASIIGQTSLDHITLANQVKMELGKWFGSEVDAWKLIEVFNIQYALPVQQKVSHSRSTADFRLSDQLFICGDHMLNSSINGAMKAGRLAAEAIIDM